MEMTRQALEDYTNKLLLEIHKDFGIPLEELTNRYIKETCLPCTPTVGPSKTKREVKPKPDANMCQYLTAKGQPCKFTSKEGENMCGIHLRKNGNTTTAPTKNDTPCKGLTAKGGPCKFKALTNCEYCGTHQKKINGAAPRNPSAPKDLKDRLALLTEEPEEPEAELEDLLDPEDVDELRERLRDPLINKAIKNRLEEEQDEEIDEEDNWEEQMCETPNSRQKLNELLSNESILTADTDED